MALQRHIELLRDWEQGYETSRRQLETVVRYIEALSPSKSQPTPWLNALSTEPGMAALRAYVSRGCIQRVGMTGWHEAQRAQTAFLGLKAYYTFCQQWSREMESLVAEALAALGSSEAASFRNKADALFIAACQTDALRKEHALLGAILESVGVSTSRSELRVYLNVWKLRPYVPEGLSTRRASTE